MFVFVVSFICELNRTVQQEQEDEQGGFPKREKLAVFSTQSLCVCVCVCV